MLLEDNTKPNHPHPSCCFSHLPTVAGSAWLLLCTPLLIAAAQGRLEIMRLLVDHGADINQKTETNLGLLDFVIENKSIELQMKMKMVEFLLKSHINTEYMEKKIRFIWNPWNQILIIFNQTRIQQRKIAKFVMTNSTTISL